MVVVVGEMVVVRMMRSGKQKPQKQEEELYEAWRLSELCKRLSELGA